MCLSELLPSGTTPSHYPVPFAMLHWHILQHRKISRCAKNTAPDSGIMARYACPVPTIPDRPVSHSATVGPAGSAPPGTCPMQLQIAPFVFEVIIDFFGDFLAIPSLANLNIELIPLDSKFVDLSRTLRFVQLPIVNSVSIR